MEQEYRLALDPATDWLTTYSADRLTEYALAFTEAHRRHADDHLARELACLKVQVPFMHLPMQAGDLFVGRVHQQGSHLPVAFSTEKDSRTGFVFSSLDRTGEEYAPTAALREHLDAHPGNAQSWRELADYWRDYHVPARARARFSDETVAAIPHHHLEVNPPTHASHTLYRMAGVYINHRLLLERGVPGLRDLISARIRALDESGERDESGEADANPHGRRFLEAALESLSLFDRVFSVYRAQAQALGQTDVELMMDRLSQGPPRTLREAMNLVWIANTLVGAYNVGRLDDYLAPFYEADLAAGRVDDETVIGYLKAFWELIGEYSNVFNGRVIVGGKGRRHTASANKLALLMIETTRRYPARLPQLSLRFSERQDPELYEAAIECIGGGSGFPMLYNDDVNIPSVAKAFNVSGERAAQYLPFGCGEFVLDHESFGTPNVISNILKLVELAMNDGCSLRDGVRQGPATGMLGDFASFDELYAAFRKHVDLHMRAGADAQKRIYDEAASQAPYLLLSVLYDDCLDRAKPIFSGGVRHLGGTLETYGNISASDSLAAVKKLVFTDRSVSADEMLDALRSDFEGYEHVRDACVAAPKFGNDNDEADTIAMRVHDTVCTSIRDSAHEVGLDSFLAVIINNDNHIKQGKACAASADGRRDQAPMSNGNNPTAGNDRNGATAFLNSLAKLRTDHHAGSVQNMKFSRELFTSNRELLEAMLSVYFSSGGSQAMLTVVGRDDLERAMEHPQEYQNLIVRVGGYSEYFVRLSREIQEDVLARTLN
jgi:pyruvate-formate lyase